MPGSSWGGLRGSFHVTFRLRLGRLQLASDVKGITPYFVLVITKGLIAGKILNMLGSTNVNFVVQQWNVCEVNGWLHNLPFALAYLRRSLTSSRMANSLMISSLPPPVLL